jgi:hypothetical protein
MGGVVAILLLAGVPPIVEGRGEGPPLAELRSRGRLTFALAGATAFGLNLELASAFPKLGFGLALEFGGLIGDRTAVTLHLEGTFLPPTTLLPMGRGGFIMTGGGPTIDWFLNDRWSLGTGTHLMAFFGGLNSFSLMLPLRVNWRPTERNTTEEARKGFVLGFQLGLGFSLVGLNSPSYPPNLTVSGLLTAGYGWW